MTAAVNPWMGVCLGLAAAWLYTKTQSIEFNKHLARWYFAPVLVAMAYLSQGDSLPSDDLMRHISAWQLNLDYRQQYPWSDIPQANLWLGFDYLLGVLQRWGLSKQMLLQGIPAVSLILQATVLYGLLHRAVAPRHRNAEVFLLAGALGLLVLTPRSLLGRPEMFLLIFGASAGLARTRAQVALWCIGYMALVPVYWLGWVYAAFALLLGTGSLVARVSIGAALGLIHLLFWQCYTGDYLGLLVWLKGTLYLPAKENAPLLVGLSNWFVWSWLGSLGLALATLNTRRLIKSGPLFVVLAWFALPNQVRYIAAMGFVSLPWLYQQFTVMARANRQVIPPVVVILALSSAAALSIPRTPIVPKFELGATARVYSESPYATVFYGQPGIAVEPSFALGATYPQWKDIATEGHLNCEKLLQGAFTHVIEQSINHPPACATLQAIQGPWRLWLIKKESNGSVAQ